jgi:hypothetical protein
LPVGRVFPTVAGDLVRAPDAAGGQHHGLGAEQVEAAALAVIPERAGDAAIVFQQREHGVLHENIQPEMDAVILQGADHFEAGAVAHVRQARIAVAAEIALQDAPIGGAVEERAPGFQLADAVGRFLRVQFRHAPVVEILAAAHGVGEMNFPVIALIHIG